MKTDVEDEEGIKESQEDEEMKNAEQGTPSTYWFLEKIL